MPDDVTLDHIAPILRVLESTVCQWFELGLQLGLKYSKLKEIDKKNMEVQDCMREMVAAWLDHHGGMCTKQTLVKALLNIHCRIESSKSILAKALRHGFVNAKITKLLISGAAATGKSSLIAMLLGNPPVLKHDSTLLSRPLRHARFTAEGDSSQIWECLDNPADLKELLASGIKNLAVNNMSEPRLKRRRLLTGPAAEVTDTSSDTSNIEAAYDKSETFASLVPMLETVAKSNRLETVHWIYTIDSGGQPAFLDILPAFIRGNSVAMHTLKLDECLNDRIKMMFSIDGQLCDSDDLCYTNLQLIKTLVRSSSSSHLLFKGHKTQTKPRCAIIGTFFDKIGMNHDRLKEIDDQLQDSLQFSKNAFMLAEDGIIFPVNTCVEGEEREEKASLLREMITESEGTSVKIPIPIKWFTFELELRKQENEQGILSMDECIEVGKLFEMDGTVVKTCIKYLHEQTLLLYFEECLPNTVFMNAQSILDKVSAILFISFLNKRKFKRALHRLPNDGQDLRMLGKFDRKFLDCIPRALKCVMSKKPNALFTSNFTSDDFLVLLEYLLVIAKLPNEQYFIPCVLSTKPVSEEQKRQYFSKADALCICWDEMPIPLGLFPALVVQLLQLVDSKGNRKFKLPTSQQHQFRNAISLDCPLFGGDVLLVDSIDWMEVYYSGDYSKCPGIRRAILDGISTVINKLGYNDELRKPREGFICKHVECVSAPPHPCFVPTGDDRSNLSCSRKSSRTDKWLVPEESCWFGTTSLHSVHDESFQRRNVWKIIREQRINQGANNVPRKMMQLVFSNWTNLSLCLFVCFVASTFLAMLVWIVINSTARTTTPSPSSTVVLVEFVEFNLITGRITLLFNEPLDNTTINATGLRLQSLFSSPVSNLTLDAATESSTEGRRLFLTLTDSDIATIKKSSYLCSFRGNCYAWVSTNLGSDFAGNEVSTASNAAPGRIVTTLVQDNMPANITGHVTSEKALVDEFPTSHITDPLTLCACLSNNDLYINCKQIVSDHPNQAKKATIKILGMWYNKSLRLTWEEVVETLFCSDLVRPAAPLAKKHGVDLKPLYEKYRKKN